MPGHAGTVYNSFLFFGFLDCKSGPLCGPDCVNCQSTISWFRGIYIWGCKMGEWQRVWNKFKQMLKAEQKKLRIVLGTWPTLSR